MTVFWSIATWRARGAILGSLILAAVVLLAQPARAATFTFTNSSGITIQAGSPASPYPSDIGVSGLAGSVSQVTVSLNGFTHPCPSDLDVLLVGPNGQKVMLMSDAGGCSTVTNQTLTFNDSAGGNVPCTGPTTGTYKPTEATCATDSEPDSLPSPAPSQPYGSALSAFNGQNPNGTWHLYVNNDVAADTGSIQSWTLNLTLASSFTSTNTTVYDAATNAPWSGTEGSGASAYDTATVGGGVNGVAPTGTVTYEFFTNGGCAGSPSTTQSVFLNPNGSVPNSFATGALPQGTYSYSAFYSGDSNYFSSTGGCEPFSVATSSSTTTAVYDAATNAPWGGHETAGARAYDTASVSVTSGFTPTGTVTYAIFGNGRCAGPALSAQQVALTNGAVPPSSPTDPLVTGSYSFDASYSGDVHNRASQSGCEPFTVAAPPGTATTSTSLGSSSNPGAAGQPVTFTATVKPSPDGGTVRFADNGKTVAGCSARPVSPSTGKATCQTTFAAPGSHLVLAVYSGDPRFASSQSTLTQTVRAGVELLGQTGFVSPSGVAGVFVGCFSARSCSGSLRITFGNVTVGFRSGFTIGSDNGGIVHISLAGAGRALLASAPHHHLPVTVTFSSSSQQFTVALTLVEFGSTVAGPRIGQAAAALPGGLGLFGHTAFVSPGGVAGVLAACFSSKPCTGVLALTTAHSALGSRLFSLPPDGGGIVHVSLSNSPPQLNNGHEVRATATLTGSDGRHTSASLTLVPFH